MADSGARLPGVSVIAIHFLAVDGMLAFGHAFASSPVASDRDFALAPFTPPPLPFQASWGLEEVLDMEDDDEGRTVEAVRLALSNARRAHVKGDLVARTKALLSGCASPLWVWWGPDDGHSRV